MRRRTKAIPKAILDGWKLGPPPYNIDDANQPSYIPTGNIPASEQFPPFVFRFFRFFKWKPPNWSAKPL